MKLRGLLTLLFAAIIGIGSAFSQNAQADKLYSEGLSLQKIMTVKSQKAAIAKFTSAKKLYDSAANKKKCDNAISKSKRIIKELENEKPQPPRPPHGGGEKPPTSTPQTNTGSLSYGTWNGGWKNGEPHGIGTMTYNESHLIDSRDPQGRVASPGESVMGEWNEGHLVMGKWRKNDGSSESIIIGKSE